MSLFFRLSSSIYNLDHVIHPVLRVVFYVVYVVLAHLEAACDLFHFVPVHFAILEDHALSLSDWETRVLLGNLLDHTDKLAVLSHFSRKVRALNGQFVSQVGELVAELPVLS